jgi:hypothetical protein
MRFATVCCIVLGLSGCQWMKNGHVEPKAHSPITGPMPERTSAELVGYLNRQAGLLKSISYDDVRAVATENGRELGSLNDSSLFSSQPRSFRLIGAHSLAGTMIDIGSNDREFWMYAKPLGKDNYFYCSHEAFAGGDVKFPIPFDTDWVMQALGMAAYDPNAAYEVKANREQAAYVLYQRTKTRTGLPVVKTTVFNADWADGKKPAVRKHVIFDERDPKTPIASAEIVAAKTVSLPGGGYVQAPTDVILEWPQQQFKMTMKLGRERVNEDLGDRAASLFNKPSIRGSSPIDLAKYQFVVPSSYRGQSPDGRRSYRLPSLWK